MSNDEEVSAIEDAIGQLVERHVSIINSHRNRSTLSGEQAEKVCHEMGEGFEQGIREGKGEAVSRWSDLLLNITKLKRIHHESTENVCSPRSYVSTVCSDS